MRSDTLGCIWVRSDAFGHARKFRPEMAKNDSYPASASPIATSGAWFGPGPSVVSSRQAFYAIGMIGIIIPIARCFHPNGSEPLG